MSSASTKQQVIQKIKDATNILVTVSRDPDVDELSAALGMTIFLNQLGKHATAVYSGKTPPAINFLEPSNTFEDTADSLRDFIIALNKEKADHLRYKVVDDAVKIFITPYKTVISEADLEFSQGDYNVELVLALNVEDEEHLDEALTAHGKILHNADVITVTAGDIKSNLGTLDWHDKNASGVSEMLVDLLGSLKTAKVTLDEQTATAFMTGIVAITERFSNDLTSSRVMTVAAELMAAGANQQLIANELTGAEEIPETEEEAEDRPTKVAHREKEQDDKSEARDNDPTKLTIKRDQVKKPKAKPVKKDDGALEISHRGPIDLDEVAKKTQAEAQDEAARAAEAHLNKHISLNTPTETVEVVDSAPKPVEPATELPPVAVEPTPQPAPAMPEEVMSEPTMGGTLNATTEQAAEDKKRSLEKERNRTILSHSKPGASSSGDDQASFSNVPMNAAALPPDEPPTVDVFAQSPGSSHVIEPLGESLAPSTDNSALIEALTEDTKAIQEPVASSVSSSEATSAEPQAAHDAVMAALEAAPAPAPATTANAFPSVPTLEEIDKAARSGQPVPSMEIPPLPPLPPMPDFSTLPEMPAGMPTFPPTPSAEPANFNPGQFKIPGQN